MVTNLRDQFRQSFTNLGSVMRSEDTQSHNNARKCKVLIDEILEHMMHKRTQNAKDAITENVISDANPEGVFTSKMEQYLEHLEANNARDLEALLRKDEEHWSEDEERTLLRSARSRIFSN